MNLDLLVFGKVALSCLFLTVAWIFFINAIQDTKSYLEHRKDKLHQKFPDEDFINLKGIGFWFFATMFMIFAILRLWESSP